MKRFNPTVRVQILMAFAEAEWNNTRTLTEADLVEFVSARYLNGADPSPAMLGYYQRVIAALVRNGGLIREGDTYRRSIPQFQVAAVATRIMMRTQGPAPTPEEILAAISIIGRSHPDSVYLESV